MKLQQITTLSTVRAELVEAQGTNGLGFDKLSPNGGFVASSCRNGITIGEPGSEGVGRGQKPGFFKKPGFSEFLR